MENKIDWLQEIKPFFPNAFINKQNELIVEPKINAYFRLDDIKDHVDFKRKMISFLSRKCFKGETIYWQKYMMRGLNSYFRVCYNKEDWYRIYGVFGNGCGGNWLELFIQNGVKPMAIVEAAEKSNERKRKQKEGKNEQ